MNSTFLNMNSRPNAVAPAGLVDPPKVSGPYSEAASSNSPRRKAALCQAGCDPKVMDLVPLSFASSSCWADHT